MTDYPLTNVDLGVVVEPMADVVTARLRIKPGIPLANVEVSEPGAPLANVEPGVVVEPMDDVVTARLRFRVGIPLANVNPDVVSLRLSKVGAP